MKRVLVFTTIAFFASLTIAATSLTHHAVRTATITASDHAEPAAAADEKVVFNTKSLKYHCATCTWAKRCTRNCITTTLADAKARGGVPCKVCGGTCSAR
jgi:hypothetical protein